MTNRYTLEIIMIDKSLIDKKIMSGYEFLFEQKTIKACDIWLDAWEDLKELMIENDVKSVDKLDHVYRWSELPYNCVQELEQELHNAGLEDPVYYKKRINYCYELLEYVGDEKLMEGNTRRAIADSYYELGDSDQCDHLYAQWLEEDPQ